MVLQNAISKLKCILNFPNGVEVYILRSLPAIASKIKIALQEHSFEHVFFTPIYPEDKPRLLLAFDDMMDSEQYRIVINEISQCRLLKDKISIMKNQIKSLVDLEDILLDVDFTNEEITTILSELSLTEIAVLIKKYSIFSDLDVIEYREKEQVLRDCLNDYVSALPLEQKEVLTATRGIIEKR